MDESIKFNAITKLPVSLKRQAAPAKKPPLTKQKRVESSGVDFQMEKPKVKAVVLRRRPKEPPASQPATATYGLSPAGAKAVLKQLDQRADKTVKDESPTTGRQVLVLRRLPKQPPAHSTPTPAPAMDLLLNVVVKPTEADVDKASKPKKNVGKMSQQFTKGVAMSKQQLKAALKGNRLKENPNKQPRAGDLFKAQLDEERRQKREAEEKSLDIATVKEQEQEQPKNAVQAANKFRTKKIGLFDQSDVAALKEFGQRAVKPVKETIFSGVLVETIGLHPHAVKNLEDLLGIKQLTTVQQKTIPKVLAGLDVLVRSQTGSGKTLAYALPMVERLRAQESRIKRTDGVLALVIVPTRELTLQTYELFQKLLKPYTWIVPGALQGGENRKSEKARLRKGINVLVGTPGRLLDHLLHTESFKLSKLKFLVLDEADRLLELGYERDVKQLVEAIDKQRAEEKEEPSIMQRLLLSATLTEQVQQLAGLTLKDPIYIDNSDEATEAALKNTNGYQKETIEGLGEYSEDMTGVLSIPEGLQLNYIVVPAKLRLVTISALLAKELAASPKNFKAIVFMGTTEMVNFHHDVFNEALTRRVLDEDDEKLNEEDEDDADKDTPLLKGLRFFKLNGSMTQTERQGVFRGFRDCASCVLLATDVVGRGIDVTDVKLVVQYTPPQTVADFVHRVGRTARAGRRGRAVLFLAPNELQFVRHLENKRIRIQQDDMYGYLQTLLPRDSEARSLQEAASNLQHKFQSLLEEDRELHDKSCKAFVSWIKFYTTFAKELKPIFNVSSAHMGHFAKSFALKEAPSKFDSKYSAPKPQPPTNRLTYTERDPEKVQQAKRENRRLYTTTVSGEVRQMQQQQPPGAERKRLEGQRYLPDGKGKSSFMKSLSKSRALTMSEFDSGLPATTTVKRQKQT